MSSEKYIGLDVHQATISVAVVDSEGKLIMCWRFLTGINDSGRSYPKTVKNLAFRHKKGREVDGLLPFVCEWVQKLYLAVKSSSMP